MPKLCLWCDILLSGKLVSVWVRSGCIEGRQFPDHHQQRLSLCDRLSICMALSQISSIPRIHAGHGRIVVSSHNSTAVLSELSSKYPLKLLSPWTPQKNVAIVYALTYGGGLVGGDQVYLTVDVSLGAILVLLTQASQKALIYK